MNRVETDVTVTVKSGERSARRQSLKPQPANVRIENTQKFVERGFNNGALSYSKDGSEPGKLLIFNFEFANKPEKYRSGSRRDVMEVITAFQRLGFNISVDDIYTDKRKTEVIAILKEVANSDLSQTNCLIIFVFTHGSEKNLLETIDIDMGIEEIYNIFKDCKDLKDKPKMFVFQACKGGGVTTTQGTEPILNFTNENNDIVPLTILQNSIPSDIILLFSTIEGNVSFRNCYGSWFIQELCRNFYAYGRRDDVVSLIIRTTKCICGNYFYYDAGLYKKQMPLMISTLRKKFYLNTNKDRHMLIQLSEDLEKFKLRLKKLENKK